MSADKYEQAARELFDSWGWALPEVTELAAAMRQAAADEREQCVKDAREAAEIWSESCEHDRKPAQEACSYIAEVISARARGSK